MGLINGYCFAGGTFEANATIREFWLGFPIPRFMISRCDRDFGMNEILLAFGTIEHPVGHHRSRCCQRARSVETRLAHLLYGFLGRNEGANLEETTTSFVFTSTLILNLD
jgi:hypothetical protein